MNLFSFDIPFGFDQSNLFLLNRRSQHYNGNNGLSVNDVNVILDITRNFHLIFESLS